ncbi:MAG: hypothetical protein HC910_21700 [Spirulinaceae cyanobacterium SM2_1_0]|nr:hypothetical protein [Spirulinaceae cyanobacterium SM2_1_0]
MQTNQYQSIAREWWVERWLELLDSYRFKKRLERGQRYAREGNVRAIQFKGAKVLAEVEGSDAEPYRVTLSLSLFSNEDWRFATEKMSTKALYSAQLLAGEMPDNIEAVFTASGLSLFPFTLNEIHSHCTCPDKANPCKHIIAVYYDLADRFSEDPFVIFQLRGRTKTDILESLRQLRTRGKKAGGKRGSKTVKKRKSSRASQHTSLDIARFWEYAEPLDPALVVITPAPEGQTPLDRLGSLPLPASEAQTARQFLEQAYHIAGQQAAMTALNRDGQA